MGFYLWDAVIDAGQPFDIRPGAPNLIERIEGGLLSYGNDMTREHSPLECGLDGSAHSTPRRCRPGRHSASTPFAPRRRWGCRGAFVVW